jgi:hypothetical protein
MSCRAGITTRPEERKKEWLIEYPSMRNWQVFGPFASREMAQSWENSQYGCDKSHGGNEPDDRNAKWFGYRFNY